MAAGFQCGAVGLSDASGAPAVAVTSPNHRVSASSGPLATLADVVQLSGSSVFGTWFLPASRCQVGGVPAITASSSGMAFAIVASGPTPNGALRMSATDGRASGT